MKENTGSNIIVVEEFYPPIPLIFKSQKKIKETLALKE